MFNYHDWLVAESLLGEETWLIYRGERWPRFEGQVFDEEQAPIEGLTLALSNGQIMANLRWCDAAEPTEAQLVEICRQAGHALDVYDGVLEADMDRIEGEEEERHD